jgi:hypothetical protein
MPDASSGDSKLLAPRSRDIATNCQREVAIQAVEDLPNMTRKLVVESPL